MGFTFSHSLLGQLTLIFPLGTWEGKRLFELHRDVSLGNVLRVKVHGWETMTEMIQRLGSR